jgi:nitroreductase
VPVTTPLADLIIFRRSCSKLIEPGPNPEELETILRAGANAPDHGDLRPFRFIAFNHTNRSAFSDVLERALRSRLEGDPTPGQLHKERSKLERAPLVIAVVAKIDPSHKIPVSDQVLSAGAAAQSILLAALSFNYNGMWRTGEMAHDPVIKSAMGLADHDEIVGWLYLGTAPLERVPFERDVTLEEISWVWTPPGL